MATQIVIARDGQADLVIATTYQASGLWLAPDGLGRPATAWARNYAVSRDWNGAVQTDARLEQSSIALSIYASGATTNAVETITEELSEALYQFSFDLTVTVDGYSRTYAADCADVTPAEYTSGMVGGFLRLIAASVPIHPTFSH